MEVGRSRAASATCALQMALTATPLLQRSSAPMHSTRYAAGDRVWHETGSAKKQLAKVYVSCLLHTTVGIAAPVTKHTSVAVQHCKCTAVLAAVQAAVVADQNAKLSIFATRPAIYSPLYNFITEVMGTVALLLLVLLIEMQVRQCY